jgi:Tryptophan 2,3-dioxygenase (vermilion)
MTLQPVYVSHDEYFFMRALQCHEMTFTVLAGDVRAATDAVRAGSIDDGIARMAHANVVFERAAMLFRIVATMRTTGFCAFRQFTQGASAIQSDQYKRFEAACGAPSPERLLSDAFIGVPVVQAEVMSGQDDLSRACLDTQRDARFGRREWDALVAEIGTLEASHQRWKATHRSLAARMLGDSSGSGYTAGVPYLEKCLSNRLFGQLGPFMPPLAA